MAERRIRFTSDGDIVREAREEKGWTREQLAVLTDTSVGLIARFETESDYTPMRDRFERICRTLDIDPADVLIPPVFA